MYITAPERTIDHQRIEKERKKHKTRYQKLLVSLKEMDEASKWLLDDIQRERYEMGRRLILMATKEIETNITGITRSTTPEEKEAWFSHQHHRHTHTKMRYNKVTNI